MTGSIIYNHLYMYNFLHSFLLINFLFYQVIEKIYYFLFKSWWLRSNWPEIIFIPPLNLTFISFCKSLWISFISSLLFASKDIFILPPTSNSLGTYKPNLSANFSNNNLFSVTFAFWISFSSSFTSFTNFISFRSIIILKRLTTIEWMQWIFFSDFKLLSKFSSLFSYSKFCFFPKLLTDKLKSLSLKPTDFDFVSNRLFDAYFSSSYLNSWIKSIFSGSIFSTI